MLITKSRIIQIFGNKNYKAFKKQLAEAKRKRKQKRYLKIPEQLLVKLTLQQIFHLIQLKLHVVLIKECCLVAK